MDVDVIDDDDDVVVVDDISDNAKERRRMSIRRLRWDFATIWRSSWLSVMMLTLFDFLFCKQINEEVS